MTKTEKEEKAEQKRITGQLVGLVNDIMQVKVSSFGAVVKEIKEWELAMSRRELIAFLTQNQTEYIKYLSKVSFSSYFAKLKYLSAIIKNQLANISFLKQKEEEKQEIAKLTNKAVEQNIYTPKPNINNKNKRKGFDDIEDEI